MKYLTLGLVASVLLTAGCGYNRIGAPLPKKTNKAVITQTEAAAPAPLLLKDAFAKAKAFAQTTYGDDFRAVMAFGDKVFDVQGKPQPGVWQFNMVGHKRGETGYTYVKIKVGTDGNAFVDPKTGGPFVDKNNQHQLPVLDLDTNLAAEAGAEIVMTQGYGKKYPPTWPISFEVRPSDRLKQTVAVYKWSHMAQGQVQWFVDTSLNPVTGEIVENDASHL